MYCTTCLVSHSSSLALLLSLISHLTHSFSPLFLLSLSPPQPSHTLYYITLNLEKQTASIASNTNIRMIMVLCKLYWKTWNGPDCLGMTLL